MDCGPGSASFALVAWTQRQRYGRWSFWQRGTGETMMQHHCTGTERSEPVDVRDPSTTSVAHVFKCRGCGASPKRETRIKWYAKKDWKRC